MLLNVALHGMERAAGVRYHRLGSDAASDGAGVPGAGPIRRRPCRPVHHQGAGRTGQGTAGRVAGAQRAGLQRGQDAYRPRSTRASTSWGSPSAAIDGKLLIKPSKAAVRRIRERLRAEMRSLRGANAVAVLARLNPIVRGWSAYYRTVVSSKVFSALDNYMWKLTYRWAKHSHPNKPRHWVVDRYFGRFNTSRQDRWVFGDRDSGAYLRKFAWTKIVRHQMVNGTSVARRPGPGRLLGRPAPQGATPADGPDHACACCRRSTAAARSAGNLLLPADRPPQSPREWEQWLADHPQGDGRNTHRRRARGTPDASTDLRLIHAHCHRRHHAAAARPALRLPASPQGLLEPDAVKVARPVLRGPGAAMRPGYPADECAVLPMSGCP